MTVLVKLRINESFHPKKGTVGLYFRKRTCQIDFIAYTFIATHLKKHKQPALHSLH